jgi:hypothetical protein
MTDTIKIPRATVQQALEALTIYSDAQCLLKGRNAITALRKALEQQAEPVQERITHITWDERGVRTVNGIPDDAPQRPWVGLKDEDRCEFAAAQYGWEDLLIAAEAKLKERNT